jgi:hypothetical protein
MKKAIKSFFSATAPARSQDRAAVVDTRDYTTWVVVGVERHSEIKDPPCWLIGLEELETMVPAQHHSAEWPQLATNHLSNLGLGG